MLPSNGKKVLQDFNYHMTISEWKFIMKYVRKHKSFKWFCFLMLLSFRGLRPSEALAINIMDFNEDFSKLNFREAKTNKLRSREHIIPALARVIKTYIEMNRHRLRDGYLFSYYKVKVNGKPYMSSKTASTWFSKEVRDEIKREQDWMGECYEFETKKGNIQKRYRISLYSFRRFFETYIYVNNDFAPHSKKLIQELMEYSSKFDPLKHYIKLVHKKEEKAQILDKTLNPLAKYVTEGQTQLDNFI